MNCKYCNSQNIIKFGTHTDVDGIEIQRYFCKDCKRKFVPNTLPKMQTPTNQVSAALRMYYGGMSLDAIQGCLEQEYKNKVAESTIYYWITRFTNEPRRCPPCRRARKQQRSGSYGGLYSYSSRS